MRVKRGSMNVVVEGIDILNEKQADYESQILPTLSAKLIPQFGRRMKRSKYPWRLNNGKRTIS
jgi:hypothetical protein